MSSQNAKASILNKTPGKESVTSTIKDFDENGITRKNSLEDSSKVRSLELLGSKCLSERKLSAFSIYYSDN